MSKIENLKLRRIDVLDSIKLRYASASSGGPIDGGSLNDIEIWGSSDLGSYNSAATCHRCGRSYEWGMCPYCDDSGSDSGGYGSYYDSYGSSGSYSDVCPYCGGTLFRISGSSSKRCSNCGHIVLGDVYVDGSGSNPPYTGGGGGIPTTPKEPEKPETPTPDPETSDPIEDTPTKVPNGDCVIGTIVEAARRLGVKLDLFAVKELIKSRYTFIEGKGLDSNQVPDALEEYFEIMLFAYEEDVLKGIDKGLNSVANDINIKHAVLITSYNNSSERITFGHYDSVDGREYEDTCLTSERYQFFVIKRMKKDYPK